MSMKKKEISISQQECSFWSDSYINTKVTYKNKTLSVEEYLNKMIPYLKDIKIILKNLQTWEIQLTIANNFISSIDNNEQHAMHSKSDNIEIMINDETDEVIKELFD